jgi:hypothetical protein
MLLRDARGYALANAGHDTRALQNCGHRSIQHTVRHTELSPTQSRISGGNERPLFMSKADDERSTIRTIVICGNTQTIHVERP